MSSRDANPPPTPLRRVLYNFIPFSHVRPLNKGRERKSGGATSANTHSRSHAQCLWCGTHTYTHGAHYFLFRKESQLCVLQRACNSPAHSLISSAECLAQIFTAHTQPGHFIRAFASARAASNRECSAPRVLMLDIIL